MLRPTTTTTGTHHPAMGVFESWHNNNGSHNSNNNNSNSNSNNNSNSHSSPQLSQTPQTVVVTAKGLKHTAGLLESRKYKTQGFVKELVGILGSLGVEGWKEVGNTGLVKIEKVSGSLTNAVFFVSRARALTVLLRIYGASSSSLISRVRELHTLHVLSSRYGIGPRVYGTFENGRVEEYFESEALTAEEMREEEVSRWIGMRMAELHRVDVRAAELEGGGGGGSDMDMVYRNVKNWMEAGWEVVRLASGEKRRRLDLVDLARFGDEWKHYWRDLMAWERDNGPSGRVFAHNDTQYGNLLRLKNQAPSHHSIIVVDFEYAGVNPAAFDIANHFHEWTANYHGRTPHVLDPTRYPRLSERMNFYKGYLEDHEHEQALDLDERVQRWSAASHAMWAIWGVVQARESVVLDSDGDGDEFDYIGYALCRMRLFRDHIST